MRAPLRDRIAFWLERFKLIRPLLLKYDGPAPTGQRYVNRINSHVVVIGGGGDG